MNVERRKVCVYCSASNAVPETYIDMAREFGRALGLRGFDLVFGGGNAGLMGPLAVEIQANGGKVKSIIPKWDRDRPMWFEKSDEIAECADLRHRKALFQESSSAFIALPGGFGTLDEMLDMTVLKHIGKHDVPLVYLNHNGFFDDLLRFYGRIFAEKFAAEIYRDLFFVASTPDEALDYVQNYKLSGASGTWGLRG